MSILAGTAHVDILPQFSSFEARLTSGMAGATKAAEGQIVSGIERAGAQGAAKLEGALAQAGAKGGASLKAGLSGPTGDLEKGFKGLLSQVTSLGPGTSALSGQLGGLGSVGKSALSGLASEGLTLQSALGAAGVGAAGLAVVLGGAALSGIGKFTAAAGEVRKLQATLGSTAEDASKLRNVAIGLGVDVDTMGKALFKLGPILEKNKGDLGGVNVEIAHNADGSTNLVKTLDNMRTAYQSITDPVQKSQFALDAFKKTGLELRPILSATNEQFAAMAAHGPILSDRDLKSAKELSIAQRELKQSVETLEIALAKGLAPVVTTVVHGFTALVDAGEKVHLPIVGIASASLAAGLALKVLSGHFVAEAAAAEAAAAANTAAAATAGGIGLLGGALVALPIVGVTAGLVALSNHFSDSRDKANELAKSNDGVSAAIDRLDPHTKKMFGLKSAHDQAASSAKDLKSAENDVATQLEETAKQADLAAKAFDRLVTAQESDLDANIAMDHALLTARRSAEGVTEAELALVRAHKDVEDKQAALTKAQQDGSATADDIRNATLDLETAQLAQQRAVEGVTDAQNAQRDALIDAAKKVRDKQVADEEATGQTATAEEKVRLFITALRDQAGTLAPGSELRTNLEAYADKLENGIPHEVRTLVIADTKAANDGLDGIRDKIRALDGSSATITTFHNDSTVSHDDLSHAVGDGSGTSEPRASGGPLVPGRSYTVGEDGIERVEMFPGGGGLVIPHGSVGTPTTRTESTASAAIDYDRLGAAVAAAMAANPPRAYVVSSDLSSGLYGRSKARS